MRRMIFSILFLFLANMAVADCCGTTSNADKIQLILIQCFFLMEPLMLMKQIFRWRMFLYTEKNGEQDLFNSMNDGVDEIQEFERTKAKKNKSTTNK